MLGVSIVNRCWNLLLFCEDHENREAQWHAATVEKCHEQRAVLGNGFPGRRDFDFEFTLTGSVTRRRALCS